MKKRKTIEIEAEIFKKLQMQAVENDVSFKFLLEQIIYKSVKEIDLCQIKSDI